MTWQSARRKESLRDEPLNLKRLLIEREESVEGREGKVLLIPSQSSSRDGRRKKKEGVIRSQGRENRDGAMG